MNTPSHRSIRKKRLRRIHPSNQTLVVDTTLGRKKYTHPTFPVLNLPSLVPSTITPQHHHYQQQYQQQQQQQQHRRRREGPPSPPAYLRTSVIFLPVPVHPPAPVALPIPPRPVSTASSAYNQHYQHYQHYQQSLRQPCLPHYPQYAVQPPVATAAAYTTQRPATTLPSYPRVAQNPIHKPGDRYPKQHQLPKQRGANPHTSNRTSQSNISSYSSPSCGPPKRFPNNLWSPRKICRSLAKGPASENSFENRGQKEREEQRAHYEVIPRSECGPGHESEVSRPRSFPPAETKSTTTTTMTKKGGIHLGFATYMITSFMLAYNGIMSVFLLQASRVPDGKA
ncbi:MAG: hypothetical protein J3R72DRAFT_157723 [Linnemannia gamsii]|nr:MAG: hypothetical protein J3R72DRAFT_157723 [Linnemannia gamsii]